MCVSAYYIRDHCLFVCFLFIYFVIIFFNHHAPVSQIK